jgi:hypothetical protein
MQGPMQCMPKRADCNPMPCCNVQIGSTSQPPQRDSYMQLWRHIALISLAPSLCLVAKDGIPKHPHQPCECPLIHPIKSLK